MAKPGPKPGYKHTEETKKKISQAVVKSGAFSVHVRKRYSDKRTREGKQLERVMQGLTNDCGGASDLTASAMLILDSIRSKLIVLFQIGKYVDEQVSIVNDAGELIPCLGRNYTAYSEGLRRDLQALAGLAKVKPSKVPSLKQIISEHEAKK